MEIQQSPQYANYIRSLKWTVLDTPHGYFYIKKLPFLGGLLKIQRVLTLPPLKTLLPIISNYRIHTISIEPDSRIKNQTLKKWLATLPPNIRINTDYFLPTKTIRVNLLRTEHQIFQAFSEAKRRAVRRAQKNMITITQSSDIQSFIRLKNKAAGFLGSMTTYGIDKLWNIFPEKNKTILFATSNQQYVGEILLLFWDSVAYYWIAGATKKGKKLFAPTLLVWEALNVAKARGAEAFDFVGVWDERLPHKNLQWKGFTKFKEGFGGTALYYPLLLTK